MAPPGLPGHRIDRLLGRGGSGEVWLAWSRRAVPEPVAVKVVAAADPAAVDRWSAHAALLRRCAHPNLLAIEQVMRSPEAVLLVSPYLAGGSLAELLGEVGTLTEGELVALVEPLAGALATLHRHRAIHGDVKPANILLDPDGTPVLADATLEPTGDLDRVGRTGRPGETGRRRATPGYLAPECADPAVVPTPAADVFALGVVAYEALTGSAPHRGSAAEVLAAAAEAAHRPLSAWLGPSVAVADVVEAALHPDLTRRPDPLTFARRLRAAVGDQEVHLAVPTVPAWPVGLDHTRTVALDRQRQPVWPTPRRPRWIRPAQAAAAAAGVALVLGVTAPLALAPVPSVPVPPARLVSSPTRGPSSGAAPGCSPNRGRLPAGQRPRAGQPLAPGRPAVVDVAGIGCGVTLGWHDAVLTVDDGRRSRRYAVGRHRDQVLAGDWDGDGSAGIAVYEPDHGRVLYADWLPRSPGATVRAGWVDEVAQAGQARVTRRRDGRDEITVKPPR